MTTLVMDILGFLIYTLMVFCAGIVVGQQLDRRAAQSRAYRARHRDGEAG